MISSFRRVMNVVFFLFSDSPASEFYMPTFRNRHSVPKQRRHIKFRRRGITRKKEHVVSFLFFHKIPLIMRFLVVAYLAMLSYHSFRETGQTTRKLSQVTESRCVKWFQLLSDHEESDEISILYSRRLPCISSITEIKFNKIHCI